MKKFMFVLIAGMVHCSFVFADYSLANNGKKVVCRGSDNLSVDLNAKRTKMKLTVEGESSGQMNITSKNTDKNTFATYKTSEGILKLSNLGDTFTYSDSEDVFDLNCK